MNYQFSISFSGEAELSIICQKYLSFAKTKAINIAKERKTNFNKIIQISDFYKGNMVQVSIKINAILPFLNINIKCEYLKFAISNDGLSIIDINGKDTENKGVFYYFYEKDSTDGFIPFKKLFRSSEIKTSYDFQKTNQGNLINQTHFLSGSQYSGQMMTEVQKILGTNDLDIKYRFDYYETNGIYTNNQGKKYLITINTSGVYYKELSVINNIATGDNTNNDAIMLLSTQEFYQGFCLSVTQGWSFTKKGDAAVNTTYFFDGTKITGQVYLIQFSESYDSENKMILNATIQKIQEGILINHEYFNILSPIIGNLMDDQFFQNPEVLTNSTYSQTQKSPLHITSIGNVVDIYYVDDNEYICPISAWFDNNDDLKIYNYYFKKTYKLPLTNSTSGFNDVNDFYKFGFLKEGNLTINNYNLNTSPIFYNFTIKHGLMINDDMSLLVEDNFGDYDKEFEVKIENGINFDNFNYQVINGVYPNLTPYINENYSSIIKQIKQYINDYKNYYNMYIDNFLNYSYKAVQENNNIYKSYMVPDYIDFKNQVDNINHFLDINDPDNNYDRIGSFTELITLNKLEDIPLYNIKFLPYLYHINNNMLSIFNTFTPTYFANILSTFNTINNTLMSIVNDAYNYKNLILSFFNDFYKFTQQNKDFSKIDFYELSSKIAIINSYLSNISSIHNSYNTQINLINSLISSLNSFYQKIKEYNDTIIDLKNTNFKGYLGFTFDQVATVQVGNSPTTQIYDNYFLAQKIYNIIITEKVKIKNSKMTNFSFLFNYSCRNSLTVYKKEVSIPDYYVINHEDIGATLNEIDIKRNGTKTNKYSLVKSNEFALFKRTDTYYNSVLQSQTDYSLVDSFYNKKDFTFYDYNNNPLNFTFGDIYVNLGNQRYFYDNLDNYAELIDQDFTTTTIPLNYTKNKVSNVSCVYTYDDYNYTNNIKQITNNLNLYNENSDDIININSPIINDNRIILKFFEKNPNFTYNDYYKDIISNDGVLYFNFIKDAENYKYVISSNFLGYRDNLITLTNITEYSIINNNFVNFIGIPF